MKKNKANAKDNFLDYIPVHNDKFKTKNENGNITILVENKGIFNKIAQKCFKKPAVTQVHLEETGNFIWPLIDGKRTVYDISVLVKKHFGDKCEPLYERLIKYLKILESYGFIMLNKCEDKKN